MGTPDPDEDPYALVDRLLDAVQVKHLEMAQLVGEYRDLLYDLQDRPFNEDAKRLARSLPGAKYHVSTTYVRETWLVLEAELKRMFPRDD